MAITRSLTNPTMYVLTTLTWVSSPRAATLKTAAFTPPQGFDVTSVDGVATAAEMAVLEDVNEYRRNAGIPELEWTKPSRFMLMSVLLNSLTRFDIYDSFVKPGLKNGEIPSSLENRLGETKWGHNIWIGGIPYPLTNWKPSIFTHSTQNIG